MFDPFVHEDLALDAAIAAVYEDLKKLKPEEDGYRTTAKQLTELYAIKHETAKLSLQAQEKHAANQLAQAQSQWEAERAERPFWQRIEPNTAATVAGNLLVALIVVKYEQTGVISSKVTSFMKKF